MCEAARRCLRRTRETDACVLPQIDAWHSSRSLEDSILAAYCAAPYDAGCPFCKPSVTQPGILVVDDNPRILRFVRDTLSWAGYGPLVTGAPDDLARIILTEKPHLVLLDLVLPSSPVIFISAYRCDETVAADYIAKPFSPTELVARVRAALRRHAEPAPFVSERSPSTTRSGR